ncbi:hypothetical protein AJ79_04150 [Helicocarpus griseus UAMH5409]|uniref:Uncharacterized protein n=1 Tax=Helicocarpus griseus UAMH5409 TaxID=1447875 RepID=A0A2B7XVJ9_9EURO|nr:hypothetical protein AJ79_04150 [Helicocarpus griseus UAMH5409]
MRLRNSGFWAILCIACESIAQQATPAVPPTPIPSYSGCPVDGPVLPRPTNLSKSKHIRAVTENLSTALDSAIDGEAKAGWDVKNASFSLAFVSPHDDEFGAEGGQPLWEYHHLAEGNTKGTKSLNGDSQYLIGSISKLFSNLILLKSGLNLEDSVTKYLPELKNDSSPVRWENITLASLGEHLSGIPPNYNGFEFYFLAPLYEKLGFPHLSESDYDGCGIAGLSSSCTKEQLLNGMLEISPVSVPFSRPLYSQLSYTLFILAVSEATGKDYDQLLDELVIQPMGMKNTGASPGDDAKAVIPPGDTVSWGADFGINAPGGGLYSSINDLTLLANSVLDKTALENPDQVRKWLKPKSMSSSRSTLVGDPWEIQRTTNLTPDHPHTIDIYAKSGGSNGYVSQFSLVDQYGVGFLALTAGPPGSVSILNDALIGSLMPAIEQETRDQAQKYLGNFTSGAATSSELAKKQSEAPVTLALSMDDKPGLKLDALTRNGSSIIEGILTIFTQALPMTGILNPDFRLYPSEYEVPVPADDKDAYSNLPFDSEKGRKNLVREHWRINIDMVPQDNKRMSDLPAQGALVDICLSWQLADWVTYGGQGIDKVVFVLEEKSREVVGVEVPALRSGRLAKEG